MGNGGFSQGFYNTSSCWDAPMYYMKHRSMNTGTDTTCHAYDGSEALGVDQGCDYYYQYKDSYCSEPVYAAPMKQLIGMCMANEDEGRWPFHHPYGIKMDRPVKIFFKATLKVSSEFHLTLHVSVSPTI